MNDPHLILQKNLQVWSSQSPKWGLMLPYMSHRHIEWCQSKDGERNLKNTKDHYFLHSEKSPKTEAKKWVESLHLKGVSSLFVYGVGLGYFYEALIPWLKKDFQRRVVFLEDDLTVIYRFLETDLATKLLKDAQVQLFYFEDLQKEEELFDLLYWNFAFRHITVESLPSYGKYKKESFDALAHKIAYDSSVKNALVDEYVRHGASFYRNFYRNMLHLKHSFVGNHLFGQFPNVPAIICGAGPSLEKQLPLLKQLKEKALIFAGGSSLNALTAAGIQPHFGAGIDPNSAQAQRLRTNQAKEVPFIYRNRLHHEAFQLIPGPALYITGSGGYDTSEYFEKKLHIDQDLFIDEGHNVVNFCVEIAQMMGCNPILFVGMDLAYTGMKQYAPGIIEDPSVSKKSFEGSKGENEVILRKDIYGNPLHTLWKWVAESEWISDYAKDHFLLTLINCTEGGLGFPDIVNKPFKEAIAEFLGTEMNLNDWVYGEIQSAPMPKGTGTKVKKAMLELERSLERSIEHIKILIQETEVSKARVKKGEGEGRQSGLAALAETELAEEIAYKYVLDVFNEVYSRLLGREIHDIKMKRLSEKQLNLERLELNIKKFKLLLSTAESNFELIQQALKEHKVKRKRKSGSLPLKSEQREDYSMSNGRLSIQDPLLGISYDRPFDPTFIPAKRIDGQKLDETQTIKVLYDASFNEVECYIIKNMKKEGQALYFYPSGNVKMESYYQSGHLHGPSTYFSEEGTILAQSWFIEGERTGRSVWYYPSGAVYSIQYFKNGHWVNTQQFFTEEGNLRHSFS